MPGSSVTAHWTLGGRATSGGSMQCRAVGNAWSEITLPVQIPNGGVDVERERADAAQRTFHPLICSRASIVTAN